MGRCSSTAQLWLVQDSVTAFLKVLLGSTKHGVVFPTLLLDRVGRI